MTYCVAISVNAGICFIADSRTNAGVDNVSTYSKMHVFGVAGDRQIVVLSAGNLATTQGVISQLKKDIKLGAGQHLLNLPHLADAADYLGEVSVAQQAKHTVGGANYEASFILGGQIIGQNSNAYLVYPQGNHITTSSDTPFLQIGESKYGKPILDRIISLDSSLETSTLCGLVSMDSTIRSNLTVGPPIEVMIYEQDSLTRDRYYRFEESSEYMRELSRSWDGKLKEAFAGLPPIAWSANWDDVEHRRS
ncbi:MAG: peptidase [Pseudomonadales bacterium]|jgi:putative proteasome-type protease|nr:peptidase [Pseudomonadales bacterium]MDP4639429.1 peptidase [Pseudomonadales bacterium]MDP4764732.1 peptidase [Pseudomonadales bacterium]MDP4876393.1 peptidase [Pseudomonadales bacterium]MDP4911934.1 peptidase [Pseudomonadales bacterium]